MSDRMTDGLEESIRHLAARGGYRGLEKGNGPTPHSFPMDTDGNIHPEYHPMQQQARQQERYAESQEISLADSIIQFSNEIASMLEEAAESTVTTAQSEAAQLRVLASKVRASGAGSRK